ncbi:MAG TPA: hypothetical protein ACFYD3_00420 [Candidatus Hypogeohydataceae bacterium YC41]
MSWIQQSLKRFREEMRQAFAMEGREGLTEEERVLLERMAQAVVRRRMATPAILFLESLMPLSYIGSQVMHFLRPFMTFLFSQEEYDRLSQLLERRSTIEHLIEAIRRVEGGNPPRAEWRKKDNG